MNVDFSPKKQFQQNDTLRKELAVIANSDNFHQALSYAVSEFVMRTNPSAEQITAVRAFINTLLLLPVESQPMPAFPQKTLDPAAYEPRRAPTSSHEK